MFSQECPRGSLCGKLDLRGGIEINFRKISKERNKKGLENMQNPARILISDEKKYKLVN